MPGIIERADSGRALYILDDGYDYAGLLAAYRRGEAAGTSLAGGTPARRTARVERDGRTFVIKTDTLVYGTLDARFRLWLYGAPFVPVMRKVARAIDAGFHRLQQIYMIEQAVVRDPETGSVTVTVWLVLEYLPGEVLEWSPDRESLRLRIPELLREAHKFNLTQTDPNERNFIVSDGVLKIIDMHFFSKPFFLVWPRAVIAYVDKSQIPFPVEGVFDRALVAAVRAKLRVLRFLHDLRGGVSVTCSIVRVYDKFYGSFSSAAVTSPVVRMSGSSSPRGLPGA